MISWTCDADTVIHNEYMEEDVLREFICTNWKDSTTWIFGKANISDMELNHHKDIKGIDTLIAYKFSSDQYFVEVGIVLPKDMVLSEAHVIGKTLKEKLKQLPEVERASVEMSCWFS